ncbi:MAG: wyosine [tRNA(Phe)-imidazoG37] synthetase (radical SAM superfamily) [Phenylobacterium sp.]
MTAGKVSQHSFILCNITLAKLKGEKMLWSEVRKDYPNMWVVVEALQSQQQDDEKTINEVTVVNSFNDSIEAYRSYRAIHKQQPQREYLLASTANEALKVKVQYWAGVGGRI